MVERAPTAWITAEPVVERLQLDADSWIDIARGFVRDADTVHDDLARDALWEQGKVFRYEQWHADPRLSSWQAGDARHPALREAEVWITERYHVRFDGVALAQYRDEHDSVAFHRDRELKWLEETVIGVLTTGARRPFLVRPIGTGVKTTGDDLRGVLDLSPSSGDLFVMGGRCQSAWLHAVPKVRGRCRSRISAQWRWTSRRGKPDLNPSYYAPRYFNEPSR